ncbi:MAG: hypothetical protein GW907_14305 [Betaproteobacteria bacterium]|nr:hypothetical protein [Betaproteobacteria bacterium]NCP80737.1 hypothetical protein [Rhodoferax sp.]
MKIMFSLVSFVVGFLSLVIGLGNLAFLSQTLSATLVGLGAMGLGCSCIWVSMQTLARN